VKEGIAAPVVEVELSVMRGKNFKEEGKKL